MPQVRSQTKDKGLPDKGLPDKGLPDKGLPDKRLVARLEQIEECALASASGRITQICQGRAGATAAYCFLG
jgi:hypothetical protein